MATWLGFVPLSSCIGMLYNLPPTYLKCSWQNREQYVTTYSLPSFLQYMADDKNDSYRRQELSDSSHGSKLPRIGQRHQDHCSNDSDYRSDPRPRRNSPSNDPVHESRPRTHGQHKRTISSSSVVCHAPPIDNNNRRREVVC